MTRIHYRNDFMVQLRRTDSEGNIIPIPAHPWHAVLHTAANPLYNKVVAGYCDGRLTNAVIRDDIVIFVLDGHGLQPGRLMVDWHEAIPDDAFPDGARHIHCTYDTGVELVSGMGDAVTKAEVEVQVPYIWQSAYDMAVSQGYAGTMAEYIAAAAQLPTAVETATAVHDSVETLESASQSVDASAKALEVLSSEYADGRRAIATALTNRDYPTEPAESFQSMAKKIEAMNYGAGWFAEIGYTEDNNFIREAVQYARDLAKAWNPDGSTSAMFKGNKRLVFAPMVDTSKCTNLSFAGCPALSVIPKYDTSGLTSMDYCFENCSSLSLVPALDLSNCKTGLNAFYGTKIYCLPPLDTSKMTNMSGFLRGNDIIRRVESLDLSSVTALLISYNNYSIVYMLLKNMGKSTLSTYNFAQNNAWGTGSDENRQSLIDSLITYSHDRAAAGMATATITLSANTKALLTDEEIAQITAKGFTIA